MAGIGAGLALLLGGCTFYTEEVNSEPVAQIHRLTIDETLYKGSTVKFDAGRSEDPDGSRNDLVAVWRAIECNDSSGTDCPLENEIKVEDGSIDEQFIFTIPGKLPIMVNLRVRDRRGAFADDFQLVEVVNRDPTLELQVQGYKIGGGYPLGTYVQVFASGDDDDGDALSYDWTLFPPDGSVAEERRWEQVGSDEVYELEPDIAGLWNVEVTASDPDGGEVTEQIPILIAEDSPPCIATTDPSALVDGDYILDVDEEPRRFAVLSVSDDLDLYPPPSGGQEFLGTATFTWFIATPDTAGEFVEIEGHELADYFIDPAGFAPGDQLSLRVEVADRVERTIPCDSAEPACSITDDECFQRLTWGVEIR